MKKKAVFANKSRRINSKVSNEIFAAQSFSRRRLTVLTGGLIVLIAAVFACGLNFGETQTAAKDVSTEIENALYTRQEFFGAEAVVPLPTNEARENLARLAADSAENPLLLKPLAELDEKLEKYDEAEKSLIRLSEIDVANADALAAFYDRRAAFDKEAEVLRKVLFTTEPSKRAAVFERLIDLARMHELKAYLNADFYAAVVKENPNVRLIFENTIDKLKEEKNYSEALKFIGQAKVQFPERRVALLEKEVAILLESNQTKEAEAVYAAGFDPFWSSEEADRFYEFLSEHDRLREYGAELKAKFRANPADFETGVRLALYQNHDYVYGNDEITPIILKVEAAKKIWTTDELVTATKFLLQSNDGATASRFLYTLYLREDFQKNSEQRAAVLYQLFQMFSEAENQRLPLTKGNLRFYSDIAHADQNPGITTGILSLILSDTKPQQQLDEQETSANKLFNRAAAYRIFEAYKKESPKTSPQLGQMYLDLTNFYLKMEMPDAAEKILNEFAERYENSTDYPNVALKLADGFSAMKNEAKAREIYQKVLDFLGRQKKSLAPKIAATEDDSEDADSDENASPTDSDSSYDDQPTSNFTDFSDARKTSVTYDEVLDIYVNSLAKDKKTAEILALYSAEIGKYPNEEWLYERRLTWLEQTNLTDEKLELYRTALAQFKTNDWRDKLARFFVREKRDGDFAAFSEDLIGKLNDAEIQDYLTQFVNGNASSSKAFEKQLYLKLYQTAHTRFPHNQAFASGLLNFYRAHEMETEWRTLAAEYYFESPEIRESFLDRLAKKGELRNFKQSAEGKDGIIYELFRADAAARLSDFEHAVGAYQNLNRIYPHTTEFSERLIALTRSLGQKDRQTLTESAKFSRASADYDLSSAENRTRSGEIFAELGDYDQSREQWEKIIPTASGDRETYLDTATVYWDYFQYADALRTIKNLREKVGDDALYAFETGAIFEAQHQQNEAVAEYVKAFAAHDEDDEKKEKAQRRLAKLTAEKPEILSVVKTALAAESGRRKNDPYLALGYAEFLTKVKENQLAALVLNRAVAGSQDDEFLEAARDFYQTADDQANEQFVLKRLAAAAKSPRRAIRFELQSAKNYEEAGQRDAAKNMLVNLVRRFPTNYGVLTESSDIYWRLGFEKDSVGVLQNALSKSRGAYQTALSEKLSGLLIKTDQLQSAEQILTKLHDENRANTEIFHELTNLCARTGNAELMRKAFAETVAALRASDDNDRRALDAQIADLRVSMIEAFTSAKDYRSAIEQHIEIINREPEKEELTENAVRYVQRYGGADILRDYYLKLSAEAFKNYRWNVVLARIYQANKDDENAVKSYQAALVNQPEMPELYTAIADIETSRSNYDAALSNLDAALKLTNDAPEYVKKKIEILKKAGRLAEVETEKAKLPAEPEKKAAIVDDFAEARNAVEKEKSRELYQAAFAKLTENPLNGDLQTADLTGYVNAMREAEPLDRLAERLWNLREKLAQMTAEKNSTDSGEGEKRLNLLNAALTEAVGTIAENYGTDEERAALHENLLKQINAISPASDQFHTLSTIQNLSVRAGFGDLTEMILRKRVEQPLPDSERYYDARRLADFYNERGAYQKAFDVLKKYNFGDWSDEAAAARLINNRAAELDALRAIYRKPADQLAVSENRDVARFLEILYADNRAELDAVAGQSSVYQLQTINFLLGKGERELAHKAIENAALPLAWKASRHAETSLALHEYEDSAECYFCTALQLDSIGNLVKQTPDKKSFLLNDDWFRLTREYGEWLFEKPDKTFAPSNFLAAMTENTPSDANQQFKLGEFYLQKKDYQKAIEHLRLAIETDNFAVDDEAKSVTLGAAYFLSGDRNSAETAWKNALANDEDQTVESGLIYFDALNKFGLGGEARKAMPPIIVEFLKNGNAEDSKELQELVRKIAASFDDEKQRANYFREILNQRLTDKSLAAMLLNENLIAPNERKQFYELIISRSDEVTDSDYDFTAVQARIFGGDDAEAVYEQENDYRVEESESRRVEWQRKYLEYLLERRENYSQIEILISAIEKELSNHFARPAWLRLAKMNAQIRARKYDREAAERFVGIRVTEAASAVKPPNLVRFNDVRSVLFAENKPAEAAALAEAFFARNLALNQFDTANFAGLGRAFFQKNESEKALHVLRLMTAASDDAKKDATLAEVFALESVKARNADAVKIEANESGLPSQADALRLAAEISSEFSQNDAAIEFRRSLAELNPTDSINKIALAKLLNERDESSDAVDLLTQIINDRNARRADRWQARALLNAEMPNNQFDAFSQFYSGIFAVKNSTANAAEFFVNALVADKDAPTDARQKLVEIYALNGQSFAALKFAATDQSAKSDDLLRTLSEAAEKVGDLSKASEYELARANGGDAARIAVLRKLFAEKNARTTDFTVNKENTRSL